MKQRAGALVLALGVFVAAALFSSGTAHARTVDPQPAPATGNQASVAEATQDDIRVLLGCWVTPKAGVDAVNARSAPNTSASRNGIINAGQTADADCVATSGGTYTACGGTSNWWVRVTWVGTSYVALNCVNWYYD